MTTTTLPTRNEAWGFFGTMTLAGADAQQAWGAASAMIAAETDASPEGVRDFLDSRHGRHFANTVTDGLAAEQGLEEAIESAIARWQGWRIGRQTSRETGIPAGLPFLTGWAAHFQVLDEMGAEDTEAANEWGRARVGASMDQSVIPGASAFGDAVAPFGVGEGGFGEGGA